MIDAPNSRSVAVDCLNLRQGDVIDLNDLHLPGVDGEVSSEQIVVLSQTCDVVQSSKTRCLVAPIITDPTNEILSGSRKGQKPLHLYLKSSANGTDVRVANMEYAVSIPKEQLVGLPLAARYVEEQSSESARAIAWRIGRAFNRFPFPGEVYPAFSKLRRKAQDKAETTGNFGRVLDLIEDIRVSANQWAEPGRRLTLYIIVMEEKLIPPDDMDPDWQWDVNSVRGLRNGEQPILEIDRVSELILANLHADMTTLANLWRILGEAIQEKLLKPMLDEEVAIFDVVVLSDAEFSYRQYQRTESLDLEVLSTSVGSPE